MNSLIPVLNGRTNWCGERMSKLCLDGFNMYLPEGPGTHMVQEPQPYQICSQPRLCLHLLNKLHSVFHDKTKYMPPVSVCLQRGRKAWCVPAGCSPDGAPTPRESLLWASGASDLLTLKMQTLWNINQQLNPPVISCFPFGFSWDWNRFVSHLRWKPAN